MIRVTGMMRVRNEGAWCRAAVASILPVCDRVLILDDHSEDGTPEICRSVSDQVRVIPSPFRGLDEARDKNYLLGEVESTGADWCMCIDGDEILERTGPDVIRTQLQNRMGDCFSLRIVFLWNSPLTVRLDGVYGSFCRPSIFRLHTGARFPVTGNGGQFHCGSVPAGLRPCSTPAEARLFHLGYMRRCDRLMKYRWYNTTDPNNEREDCYRHMVQGDLPEVPAYLKLKHAGPLRLERIR
jgi:glycosyltransferase involved in cell wall biosynthesis